MDEGTLILFVLDDCKTFTIFARMEGLVYKRHFAMLLGVAYKNLCK